MTALWASGLAQARSSISSSRGGIGGSSMAGRRVPRAAPAGPGRRAPLPRPAECKKGAGRQHRKQQQQQKQQQQGGGAALLARGGGGGDAGGQTVQQAIDFSAVDKFEVRGNQVILTLSSSDAGDGADGAAAEAAVVQQDQVMDAVVKVYCTHTEPHYSLPWQRKRQYTSSSSGLVVIGPDGDRFLLTNAHSVEYQSQVRVKRRGDDRKFLATVVSVGTECDIALLKVEEEAFWEGVGHVRFGQLPMLQDSVFVVGYPIGGETISVTSGVVSRIEVTAYAHGATELLGVQIDAAINSGNSGGPVFNEYGECVGIAFQSYAGSDAENIGYVIPTPVIDHFLLDYKRTGTFTGFPALGVQWQRMESPALRAAFSMGDAQKGVLVRSVQPCSHAHGVLQAGDVLLAFDGVEIASDGTVPFLSGERISFSYLTSQKFTGDVVQLDVLREGQLLHHEVPLMRPNALVPHHLAGADPSYLVVAGVVFTVVTEPYLESEYGADFHREAPVKLLDKLLHTDKSFPEEQVVAVSQVLACDATMGYEEVFNTQVHSFNGQEVRNLRHLAQLCLACDEPYLRFGLAYNEVLVLETAKVQGATEEILRTHSIPSMVSRDLADLLEQHPAAAAQQAAPAPQQPDEARQQQQQEQQDAAREQQPAAAAAGLQRQGSAAIAAGAA